MAGVNKVILIGNVGKDPEIKHLEGGASLASFPLATTEVYKDKEGKRMEHTEWHNIVLWRGLADIAEKYVKKGSLIYLEGKIKSRSKEDWEGNKKFVIEIVGDNLTILSRDRNGNDHGIGHAQSSSVAPSNPSESPEDLPF